MTSPQLLEQARDIVNRKWALYAPTMEGGNRAVRVSYKIAYNPRCFWCERRVIPLGHSAECDRPGVDHRKRLLEETKAMLARTT